MYIARQPIFRRDMNVYGYELLFRENQFSQWYERSKIDGGKATAAVLTNLYENGMAELVEGRLAFVNFDEEILGLDISGIFEPGTIVIELDQGVGLEGPACDRLRELQKQGFKIALNDITHQQSLELPDYVDIVKVTVSDGDWTLYSLISENVRRQHVLSLAQKIETQEAYERAREIDFDFYQGYFFAQPTMMSHRTDSVMSDSSVYTSVIKELRQEEPSFRRIAEMIRHSVDLNYRLMRMLGRRNKKDQSDLMTVQQALAYIGLREVERWINVLMLSDFAGTKPIELIKLSLVRSLFMEQLVIGTSLQQHKYEAFTVGLFSVLDALMDMPMEMALTDIMLPEEVVDALVYGKGELADLLALIKAYEVGDFAKACTMTDILELDRDDLFDAYYQAVKEAGEIAVDIGIASA